MITTAEKGYYIAYEKLLHWQTECKISENTGLEGNMQQNASYFAVTFKKDAFLCIIQDTAAYRFYKYVFLFLTFACIDKIGNLWAGLIRFIPQVFNWAEIIPTQKRLSYQTA